MYSSTKTYGHEIGLSACFRQWRAESHCNLLHGYALSVKFVFEATELDKNNWVVDFGSLKSMKAWLESMFDHVLLVAEDDPHKDELCQLAGLDLARVIVVPEIGCEAFSRMIYDRAVKWLVEQGYSPRVRLCSVEVREHGANSAIYQGDTPFNYGSRRKDD